MVDIFDKNIVTKFCDIWPYGLRFIDQNIPNYVWDQRKMRFYKMKFTVKVLWKYRIEQLAFNREERYTTEVYFCKVSLWKRQPYCVGVHLFRRRTPYVWDIDTLRMGQPVPFAEIHSRFHFWIYPWHHVKLKEWNNTSEGNKRDFKVATALVREPTNCRNIKHSKVINVWILY